MEGWEWQSDEGLQSLGEGKEKGSLLSLKSYWFLLSLHTLLLTLHTACPPWINTHTKRCAHTRWHTSEYMNRRIYLKFHIIYSSDFTGDQMAEAPPPSVLRCASSWVKKVNIPLVSLLNEAWKESDRTGGKRSSSLSNVEVKCPCKFLSQTHCSPRSK